MQFINDLRFMRMYKKCFKEIEKEVKELEGSVDAKSGLLWFKKHKYTQEQLLDSKYIARIDSIVANLESHVAKVARSNKISAKKLYEYQSQSETTKERIRAVIHRIESRVPTRLDKLAHSIIAFLESVIERIPVLKKVLPGAGEKPKSLK